MVPGREFDLESPQNYHRTDWGKVISQISEKKRGNTSLDKKLDEKGIIFVELLLIPLLQGTHVSPKDTVKILLFHIINVLEIGPKLHKS